MCWRNRISLNFAETLFAVVKDHNVSWTRVLHCAKHTICVSFLFEMVICVILLLEVSIWVYTHRKLSQLLGWWNLKTGVWVFLSQKLLFLGECLAEWDIWLGLLAPTSCELLSRSIIISLYHIDVWVLYWLHTQDLGVEEPSLCVLLVLITVFTCWQLSSLLFRIFAWDLWFQGYRRFHSIMVVVLGQWTLVKIFIVVRFWRWCFDF